MPESMKRSSPARATGSRQTALACAEVCDDKKAENIVILDLRKLSFISDFFVIATTQSDRQARAIAEEIQIQFKQKGIRILGSEGLQDGKWVLLDYADVVVHLFLGESRAFYDLESHWSDAPRLTWKAKPSPAAAPKRTGRRKIAKAK